MWWHQGNMYRFPTGDYCTVIYFHILAQDNVYFKEDCCILNTSYTSCNAVWQSLELARLFFVPVMEPEKLIWVARNVLEHINSQHFCFNDLHIHFCQLPLSPNYSVVGLLQCAWFWIMEGNQSTGGPANVSEEQNQSMSPNLFTVRWHVHFILSVWINQGNQLKKKIITNKRCRTTDQNQSLGSLNENTTAGLTMVPPTAFLAYLSSSRVYRFINDCWVKQ